MNRDQKAAVVDEIAGQIQESEAVFAVDYRGISVPHAADLRTKLRDADATFRVVKNSLTERAAEKAGVDGLSGVLDGPTALAFVRGDAALAAKTLSDFARQTDTLAFKGGILGSETLDAAQILAISKLPSREVLYGQLVGLIASPLTGLAAGMGNLISGLARQLQQIADQGLVTGEAPAAAAPAAAAEAPAEAEAAAPAEGEAEEAPATDAEAAPAEATDEPAGDAAPADDASPAAEASEAPAADTTDTNDEANASADADDPAAEAKEDA